MFWILAGALIVILALLLLRPLWQASNRSQTRSRVDGNALSRGDYDRAVYRDQLAEVDRDQERGVLNKDEAESARLEIQRRLLASDARHAADGAGASGLSVKTCLMLGLLIPALALPLYLYLGQPGMPGRPFAAADPRPSDPQKRQMLTRLAAATKRPGATADTWLALARFNQKIGRHRAAAAAYQRAYAVAGKPPHLGALYAQALVRAQGGQISDRAVTLFAAAAKANPKDARARFFLGLAQAQRGRAQAALMLWARLEAEAPKGARWLPVLRREMQRVARASTIDLGPIRAAAGVKPTAPALPGPSGADIKRAGKLTPAQRQAMIRGMVSRLEARMKQDPGNLAGWRRLGRSYAVMGDAKKSAWAYGKAAALAPTDRHIITDYAAARLRLQKPGARIDADTVQLLERLLKLDSGNALALFYLGVAAAENGRTLEAKLYWQRLLTRLPKNAPLRGRLKGLLARLDKQMQQ